MTTLKLGKKIYDLISPIGDADLEKQLDVIEKSFHYKKTLVYFWDCQTKTGLSRKKNRPKYFEVGSYGDPSVVDPATGKVSRDLSVHNAKFHVFATGLGSKKMRAAINKQLPPVAAVIPYSTHVDPFKKTHMIKLVADIEASYFIAVPRGSGGPAKNFFWVMHPKKITFTTTLMARCDGEAVTMPEDFNPKISPDILDGELGKELNKLDDQKKAESQ